MGLFEYKFDKEYSHIRLEFNYDTMQYVYYYAEVEIPFDKLNFRTKRTLKKENQKLIDNPELLESFKVKKKQMEKEAFIESFGIDLHPFQTLGGTGGTMSDEMKVFLDDLLSQEDVLIGIHRIGSNDSIAIIEDVLTNGLKLTGHQNGAIYGTNTLSNNISFYYDNNIIRDELMYANAYKDSKGSYLIRIPLYDLEEGMCYRVDENGMLRINPLYILGYVPVNDKHIDKLITKATLNNLKPKEEIPKYEESLKEENTKKL